MTNYIVENILPNIISDFTFILLVILLGYFWLCFTKRTKLYHFFNIGKKDPSVIIYTSNLINKEKGSTYDFRGHPRSYTGSTVPMYEFTMIPPILRLFNTIIPGAKELPNVLKKLTLSDIKVEYLVSPEDEKDIQMDFGTIITFGSPGYNVVSQYIQDNLDPILRMEKDNTEIINSNSEQVVCSGRNGAFLQKVAGKNNGTSFFYAAGIDENGTKGALLYLLKNWKELYEKYKTRNFAICFEFPWSREDPNGFNKPKIIFEK